MINVYNKKLYKKINNCQYTTKQAITYFLLGYYKSRINNIDMIIKSIIKQLIAIKPQNVLENYYCQYLNIYGKEWKLTLNQFLSYSYIVSEEILKSNTKYESFEIIYIFNNILKNSHLNRLKNMLKAISLGFFNLSSVCFVIK